MIADKDLPTGQPRPLGQTIEQVVNTLVRREAVGSSQISKPNLTPDQRWIRLAKPRLPAKRARWPSPPDRTSNRPPARLDGATSTWTPSLTMPLPGLGRRLKDDLPIG